MAHKKTLRRNQGTLRQGNKCQNENVPSLTPEHFSGARNAAHYGQPSGPAHCLLPTPRGWSRGKQKSLTPIPTAAPSQGCRSSAQVLVSARSCPFPHNQSCPLHESALLCLHFPRSVCGYTHRQRSLPFDLPLPGPEGPQEPALPAARPQPLSTLLQAAPAAFSFPCSLTEKEQQSRAAIGAYAGTAPVQAGPPTAPPALPARLQPSAAA